jgi:hypothetical protein
MFLLDTVTVFCCTLQGCSNRLFQCDKSCDAGSRNDTFGRLDNFFRHIRRYHPCLVVGDSCHVDNQTQAVVVDMDMESEPTDEPFSFVQEDEDGNNGSGENSEVDNPADVVEEVTLASTLEVQLPSLPRRAAKPFKSDSLNDHLDNCSAFGYYGAACSLVARSGFQCKHPPFKDIPGPWLVAFLTIARIVLLTNEEVRTLLATLLTFTYGLLSYFLDKANLLPELPLPVTTSDFQSMILNASNTHSLKSILPVPYFEHNAKTEHSFSSPTELVPMTMFMPPQSCIEEGVCDRYKSTVVSGAFFEKRNKIPAQYLSSIDETPTVLVYITLWSDGWDPNTSGKANRAPVWTATGTMIFVELGLVDDPYLANTVLMGVGPGKESHDEFFDMLVNEKTGKWEDTNGQLLPFSFYSRHHKRKVNAFITLALALQDNPERRGCADLLGGNSTTHGIFGVSCAFPKLVVPFEACDSCIDRIQRYAKNGDYSIDSTDHECENCLGWSVEKLCSKGRYKSNLGLALQEHEHGYNLTQGPGRITFEDCITAWKYATENYVDGSWNVTKTKAYLKLFCCNDDLQKRFIAEATLYINVRDCWQPAAETRHAADVLRKFRRMHGTQKHLLPKHPPIWSLFDIQDITETPMHLIMGAVKALLRSLLKFAACRDRQQDFIRRCNEILLTVRNNRLDLAKVLKFKDDRFGGFVAENYSAMAMIMPWLSHILEETTMERSEAEPVPDLLVKPVEKWTGKESKAWLKARGIKNTAKMTAPEARSTVAKLLEGGSENLPQVVDHPGRDMAHDVVRALLLFANSLICTIMLADLEGQAAKNRAQALVSLFLSQYEIVDKNLMPDRSKPIWIEKYNLLGLLRVPEHFIRHRHLRNQYEGGRIGEGMVKELRQICPNAIRDGWSRNMIKNFYRDQSLDGLCHEAQTEWLYSKSCGMLDLARCRLPSELTASQLRKFKRYREIKDVSVYIRKGYPVSVVVYKSCAGTGLHVACVETKNQQWTLHFWKLQTEAEVNDDSHGYLYFSITPGPIIPTGRKTLKVAGYQTDSFAIMLPDLWNERSEGGNYKFAVISEDWRSLDRTNNWRSPSTK